MSFIVWLVNVVVFVSVVLLNLKASQTQRRKLTSNASCAFSTISGVYQGIGRLQLAFCALVASHAMSGQALV